MIIGYGANVLSVISRYHFQILLQDILTHFFFNYSKFEIKSLINGKIYF